MLTDHDGDGLTDYEEMVLMQDPYTPDEFPRHKSPRELADEAKARGERKLLVNPTSVELAELILAGIRTTIASEENRNDAVPTLKVSKERVANLASGLQTKFDQDREILLEAGSKGEGDSLRKAHHIGPSGKVEYVTGWSHSAGLIHADELWSAFDSGTGNPIPNEAGYGDLTGADPDPALSGLGPLPPVGIWEFDGGVDPGQNPELADRLIYGNSLSELANEVWDVNDPHAVEITEIIGLPDPTRVRQGMAYGAKLKIYSSLNDYAEMAGAVVSAEGMHFSNHSYGARAGWVSYGVWVGPQTSTDPNVPTGEDNPVYEDPEFMDGVPGPGNDTITSVACAKNILSVGAVFSFLNEVNGSSDFALRHYSGRGPTDDGRIKPDLVAPGTFELPDGTVGEIGGTSQAAPAVTGTLALLDELNHDAGGDPLLASTWKALLLNTAVDGLTLDHHQRTGTDGNGDPIFVRVPGFLGPILSGLAPEGNPPVYRTFPGPDYFFGWGMVNARAAADLLYGSLRSDSGRCHICEFMLYDPSDNEVDADNTVVEIPIQFDGTSGEMKVMICWSDPAFHGQVQAAFSSGVMNPDEGPYDLDTQRLVNDLDLWVEGPGGTTYRPWVLDPEHPLNPATVAELGETNTRDNVEQVVISNPVAGDYIVKISHKGRLYQLNPVDPAETGPDDDFLLETGEGQAVSLVVSGNEIGSFKRPELVFVPGSHGETSVSTLATFLVDGFVGLRYQLQRSADLQTWTDVDAPFHLSQPVEVKTVIHPIEEGHFYRVREISPTNN
ncbi:MAG: S8 family serine peptidase [Akkermansiaceae bacterium]